MDVFVEIFIRMISHRTRCVFPFDFVASTISGTNCGAIVAVHFGKLLLTLSIELGNGSLSYTCSLDGTTEKVLPLVLSTDVISLFWLVPKIWPYVSPTIFC